MDNKQALFIITSAINTEHGIYSTDHRLQQTLDTLKSVSAVSSNIVILDGGSAPINVDQQKKILEIANPLYIDYSNTHNIKLVQQQVRNSRIVKNYCELIILSSFFESLKTEKEVKRVFKISSRYTLTDRFDLDRHFKAANKICLVGPVQSGLPPEYTNNTLYQYMSRLWSFDYSLIDYISKIYGQMFTEFQVRAMAGGYIDTEHLLYKYINPDLIEAVFPIGVRGNIAENGIEINE